MYFDYAALKAAGYARVEIEYHGAGDEGWIESITGDPPSDALEHRTGLYDAVHQSALALLEDEHGGWEINEGSTGTITVLVDEQRALLNHGERYENVRYYQSEVR